MFKPSRGDRLKAPNTAIVLTDGASTYDASKTVPYANDAKYSGIKMLAVGITNMVLLTNLLSSLFESSIVE